MPLLELSFACGESSLEVRRFAIHEALGTLFAARIWARSHDPSIDLEPLCGQAASLRLDPGYANVTNNTRVYSGIVSSAKQGKAEASEQGLSTYEVVIVPKLWLLNHRVGNRIYQHLKIPDIVDALLGEWQNRAGVEDRSRIAPHPRVQGPVRRDRLRLPEPPPRGGRHHAGLRRQRRRGVGPHASPTAPGGRSRGPGAPCATSTTRTSPPSSSSSPGSTPRRRCGPGAHVIRDDDFRRPAFELFGNAPVAPPPEDKLEQYHYQPGAFLVEPGQAGDTPAADDRGIARNEQKFGDDRASRALLASRAGKRALRFDTNVPASGPARCSPSTATRAPTSTARACS